eukprot:715110-Amphidinium_carterae.2
MYKLANETKDQRVKKLGNRDEKVVSIYISILLVANKNLHVPRGWEWSLWASKFQLSYGTSFCAPFCTVCTLQRTAEARTVLF